MAETKRGGESGVRCVITTPEATVLDTRADFVSVPLFDGQRGIGRGHAPFVGRLGVGEVRITGGAGSAAGESRRTFIEGGFVEVGHDEVTIITQRSIPAEKLDAAAARAEVEKVKAESSRGDEAIASRMRREEAARAMLRAAERKG